MSFHFGRSIAPGEFVFEGRASKAVPEPRACVERVRATPKPLRILYTLLRSHDLTPCCEGCDECQRNVSNWHDI